MWWWLLVSGLVQKDFGDRLCRSRWCWGVGPPLGSLLCDSYSICVRVRYLAVGGRRQIVLRRSRHWLLMIGSVQLLVDGLEKIQAENAESRASGSGHDWHYIV